TMQAGLTRTVMLAIPLVSFRREHGVPPDKSNGELSPLVDFGRILTRFMVGTARCAVRAASSGAIPSSFRPLLRGRRHRSAMSLPRTRTVLRCAGGFSAGLRLLLHEEGQR